MEGRATGLRRSPLDLLMRVHRTYSQHGKGVELWQTRRGIYPVYLPPYSPDLDSVEFIWKAIKRVISISSVKRVDELKQI